jgi:hypothetical protein
MHDGYGRVQVPADLITGSFEVEYRRPIVGVDLNRELDGRAVVKVVHRAEGGTAGGRDRFEERADGVFCASEISEYNYIKERNEGGKKRRTGVLPNMVHVFLNRLEPVVSDNRMDEAHAFMVRCNLLAFSSAPFPPKTTLRKTHRLEIALDIPHVPTAAAARPPRRLLDHPLFKPFPIKHAVIDELERDDLGPLVAQGGGRRRHTAREDPTDIGMMSAGGRKEDNLLLAGGGRGWVKDRGDDRYIRKVSAARISA